MEWWKSGKEIARVCDRIREMHAEQREFTQPKPKPKPSKKRSHKASKKLSGRRVINSVHESNFSPPHKRSNRRGFSSPPKLETKENEAQNEIFNVWSDDDDDEEEEYWIPAVPALKCRFCRLQCQTRYEMVIHCKTAEHVEAYIVFQTAVGSKIDPAVEEFSKAPLPTNNRNKTVPPPVEVIKKTESPAPYVNDFGGGRTISNNNNNNNNNNHNNNNKKKNDSVNNSVQSTISPKHVRKSTPPMMKMNPPVNSNKNNKKDIAEPSTNNKIPKKKKKYQTKQLTKKLAVRARDRHADPKTETLVERKSDRIYNSGEEYLQEFNITDKDVSGGAERFPIPVIIRKGVNPVDEDNNPITRPKPFNYTLENSSAQQHITISLRNIPDTNALNEINGICQCSGSHTNCLSNQCQHHGGPFYDENGLLDPEWINSFDESKQIRECNTRCGCTDCGNRVVQNGMKYKTAVQFMNSRVGFGVVALERIPRGAFVTTYRGEIITDNAAEGGYDDTYFFDLLLQSNKENALPLPVHDDEDEEEEESDGWDICGTLVSKSKKRTKKPRKSSQFYDLNKKLADRNRKTLRSVFKQTDIIQQNSIASKLSDDGDCESAQKMCNIFFEALKAEVPALMDSLNDAEIPDVLVVDAKHRGNLGRFLNHSCDPNCFSVRVFRDCVDARLHEIGFFTNKDIEIGEELTIDYAYKINKKTEPDDLIKCLCGSSKCKTWFRMKPKSTHHPLLKS
eukprot:TRINITY_DN55_c4_g1_i2.p1 TRINITY_DN55_c4_g1~~TRINITY_DN55_c4_g1_i2.p1  ORF type:complete len:775 (-),score=173.57 TRINITY_DN55_c4_g1_i2:333-2534(-)